MALGNTKKIDNKDARFGADPHYWFLKVQAAHGAEEHWLLTDGEVARFIERGNKNPEDVARLPSRGHFAIVDNEDARFGAAPEYYGVRVKHDGRLSGWFLTDHDLERIRKRVEVNREDVEREKEGWLADLFD